MTDITGNVFTVLRNLKTAPLKDHEQEFVRKFDGRERKYSRKDALYLDWLAERYGSIRLAPYDLPIEVDAKDYSAARQARTRGQRASRVRA
jgi:hypothetical protein